MCLDIHVKFLRLLKNSGVWWKVSVFYLLCKGNSMIYHRGMKFSTRDQDNDDALTSSCAAKRKGGWWYNACSNCNLNGIYYHTGNYTSTYSDGLEWYYWKGYWYSLKFTEMKVRPFYVWTKWQYLFTWFWFLNGIRLDLWEQIIW